MKQTILLKQHNMKKGLLALLLLMCSFFSANAATYYSQGTNTFNTTGSTSIWSTNRGGGGSAPSNFTTSGDIFVVQNGSTMTVTGSALTIGAGVKVQIESGGNVATTNALTFNATATFQIDNGGTYTHNNTGTWANLFAGIESFGATSNFIINNAATTGPGTPSTGFGNLTYNATANMNFSGALNDASSSTGKAIQGTLTVAGVSLRLTGATGITALTIGGDLVITTGTLTLGNGTAGGSGGGALNVYVSGNFNMSGGTLDYTATGGTAPYNAYIYFNKSGTATFTKTGGTITAASSSSRNINMVVNSGCTMDFGTNVLDALATTNLNFTVSSGATLKTGNTNGITSGNTASGSIQNLGGSRTFNAGANYEYSGTAAQVTGNGLPSSITGTFKVSNTTAAVTFSQATTVSGQVTVDAGAILATGAFTFTANTTGVAMNGSFQLDQGSWATGSATWTYGSTTGTLIFNNSSGSYVVNSDVWWPSSNGPYNVTVQNGGGVTMNVSRTVPTTGSTGTFKIVSGSVAGSALTLNGTAQLNGGSFSTAPIYGSSSTLNYNSGGTYGRTSEWSATGAGTIGTTAGYPNNVTLTNSTTLNLPNGSNNARACNGNLDIGSGSSVYADYSSGNVNLIVAGNLVLAGNLSLGSGVGGDFNLGGNWTHTTGTFTPNSRAVVLNGTSTQTITKSGGETFDYVTINKSSNNVALASAITINQTLTFTSGKLDLGANNLTFGTSASTSGASSSNYIVTSSTGKVLRSISSGGSSFAFPIGRSTSTYNPVTITNTGASTSIYTVGVAATTYSPSADGANAEWSITSGTSTTSTFAFSWTTADAGANLTASPSSGASFSYNGSSWNTTGGATVTGTPNVTTESGITSANTIWTVAKIAAVPDVALADNAGGQVATGNIVRNTTGNIIYNFQLGVTTANATLTAVSFSTTNSASDVTNYKLYYATSNSFGSASQLGSSITTSLGTGSHTFSSLSQTINSGTTGYFWITTDVPSGATLGNTIAVSAITTSDVTFGSANKTGSTSAGGTQTFIAAPTVTTNAATSVATTSVALNGTVNANANSTTASFDYGTTISYGTNIAADQSPVTGTSNTAISKTISSLGTNTLYHYRAKGANSAGTTNGSDVTFTTLSNAPTVGTGNSITSTGFTANWTAPTNDGSETYTFTVEVDDDNAFGSVNATYSSISSGTTSQAVTGLSSGTTYYFRVKAVNAGGNSAWSSVSSGVTTNSAVAPTVSTASISSITVNSASGGGNVTNDGGDAVTARGVVYNTSGSPTLADNFTTDGTGTGTYSSSLTSLSTNTTYYVKAYATNGVGTSYGSEVSFTTLAAEPATASTVAFGTKTTTSMVVNFTGGDGGRRVVYVKQGGAVSYTPTDGTSPSGVNAAFGSGTQFGTGNYAVYDGTGTTVTVTGLSANTTYHIAVYEYNNNSASSPNYYATAGTGNATTYNPTVTTTGSLSAFGNIVTGSNSSSQSYTVAGTELVSSITVTAPTGFAISLDDADYSVNPIVLTRNGSDAVPTTTIYVRFSPGSANGANSGNVTNAATSATTQNVAVSGNALAAEPTTNGSVSFGTVTSTSIIVNLPSVGDGSNRIIVVKAGSAVDASPSDASTYSASATFGSGTQIGSGNYVVYNGTGSGSSLVTVGGLTSATTYHFAVFEYNVGTGTSQNYLTSGNATGSQATAAASNATDAFRTAATGNWNSTSTWESFTNSSWIPATLTPDASASAISILNGHTVTVPNGQSISADDITVNTTGQITIASGGTLTVANGAAAPDITVNGTLVNSGTLTMTGTGTVTGSGSSYQHNIDNATIPTFTWGTGSTLNITGLVTASTSGTNITGIGSAYNIIYNCTSQQLNTSGYTVLSGAAMSVANNLTIQSTGAGNMLLASGNQTTVTVSGAYSQTGGTVWIARNASGVRGLTVVGNTSITGGTLDIDAVGGSNTYTLTVGGNLTVGSGATLQASFGTRQLIFNGSSNQDFTIDGTYTSTGIAVSVTGAGGVTLQSNASIATSLTLTSGNFTVAASKTLTINSGATVSIAGSRTLTIAGTVTNSTTTAWTVTGAVSVSNGGKYQHNINAGTIPTATWNTGSTCEITGITATTPAGGLGQSFHHFTWNCSGQTSTVNIVGALTTINGDFTVMNSATGNGLRLTNTTTTLTVGGNLNITAANGVNAKLDLATTGGAMTLKVAGNITISATGTGVAQILRNAGTGTIVFNKATGTQTFSNNYASGINTNTIVWNIGDATTSNTVQLSSDMALNATSTIVVFNGSTLDCGTQVISSGTSVTVNSGGTLKVGSLNAGGAIAGNIAAATVTLNSGSTVEYNGAGAQFATARTFSNLTVNNGSTLTLSGNVIATGTLALTSGKVVTGSNTMTVGASGAAGSVTGASSSNYVNGNLQLYVNNTATPTATFAIGDASNYTPVTVAFNGTTSGSGSLTASTTSGAHASIASSGINSSKMVNRYYTLTNSGIAGFTSYAPTFTFISGDILGGANTAAFVVRKHNGSAWSTTTTGTLTSTTSQATAVSSFSDFAIGEANTLTVDTDPSNATVCQTATNITFTSSSPSTPSPTIQWQENNGGGFANISNGGIYSGATTGTLTLASVTTGMNGYTYRAVFTNINGTVNSNSATLAVSATSVGGTASSNQTFCTGSTPSDVTLSGNTGSVTKWQYSSDAGFTSPTDISNTTTTLVGATDISNTTTRYYRAVVTSGVCAAANSSSVLITVNANGTWIGTANSSYSNAANWCGGVPASNADIIVNSNTPNNVTLTANTTVNNITMNDTLYLGGNKLTVNGAISGSSTVLSGTNTSSLEYGGSGSSTISFNQGTDGSILNPTTGTNSIKDLTVSGSGSLTLSNKVNVFDGLNVTAGTLNTGDNLVLRSTSSNTSYVGPVGGTINGQVTVERYYHKQFRGWRMATAPVSYRGIADTATKNYSVWKNWQNDFGYTNNYGTRFGGPVTPTSDNGLDDLANSANLLTYNTSGAGSYSRVLNTKSELMSDTTVGATTPANKGYFIFVRGDRTVLPTTTGTPNAFATTVLAAKGLLQTGDKTFTFTGTSGNSWLIGNPYACPVDLSSGVTFSGITNGFYVWDPNLVGASTNSPGAYTAFDRTDWNSGPVSGSTDKYLQSGQAFFVKTTSGSASLTFHEADKTTSTHNNTQTTGTGNGSTDLFNVKLFAVQSGASNTNVDGVRAKFGNYSGSVDNDDITKVAGTIESISLTRGSSNLAIEARPFITTTDTLFVKMANMVVGSNYEFFINTVNFDASVSGCKIIDNFLNTETAVNLSSNTTYPFSITSVAGSSATNRFSIVFTGAGTLPSNKLNVSAYKQNNNVVVNWEAIAETGVNVYNVEKSTTGSNFAMLSEAAAKNGNVTNTYSIVDKNPAAVNYYRIKTINKNSSEKYSIVVKVEMNGKNVSSVTVYPNPVTGNTIGLQLNGVATGVGTVRLFNNMGQLVYTETINNAGSNGSMTVEINKHLAAGTYQLQLTDAKGNSYKETVLKIN